MITYPNKVFRDIFISRRALWHLFEYGSYYREGKDASLYNYNVKTHSVIGLI